MSPSSCHVRRVRYLKLIILLLTAFAAIDNIIALLYAYERTPKRLPNIKRKRDHCVDKLREFSDRQFKAQTGLSRPIFHYLLSLIESDINKNLHMGVRSSGSCIEPIMKLFIHQRLLKGAKALDTEWMGVDPEHVWEHIWRPVALAIDRNLHNVNFKSTDHQWLQEQAQQWAFVQKAKYNCNPTYGMIGAGDGIILKIKMLMKSEFEKLQIPLDRFWNYKGFYGLNAQAFCDAWCRFIVFECRWPGSTSDITAYPQSLLYLTGIENIPDEYYFALDEAYKAIRDGKHLTPFPGTDIAKAVTEGNEEAAEIMRTFNKVFCSDRITIERAFGQLVRRWGVLWGAIPRDKLEDIQLILRVAVKLHNLCVDEYLCHRFGYETTEGEEGTGYPTPKVPREAADFARSGYEPNLDQAELPDPDIASLRADTLYHGVSDNSRVADPIADSLGRASATSSNSTADEERQFQMTATENAGRAMAATLELEPDTAVDRRNTAAATGVSELVGGLTELEQEQLNERLQRLRDNDLSAYRRLLFAIKIRNEGLRFDRRRGLID